MGGSAVGGSLCVSASSAAGNGFSRTASGDRSGHVSGVHASIGSGSDECTSAGAPILPDRGGRARAPRSCEARFLLAGAGVFGSVLVLSSALGFCARGGKVVFGGGVSPGAL